MQQEISNPAIVVGEVYVSQDGDVRCVLGTAGRMVSWRFVGSNTVSVTHEDDFAKWAVSTATESNLLRFLRGVASGSEAEFLNHLGVDAENHHESRDAIRANLVSIVHVPGGTVAFNLTPTGRSRLLALESFAPEMRLDVKLV